MQKHALALGYFFLAMFCIYTSSQGFLQKYYVPLLLAAFAFGLTGFGFLMSACTLQLLAAKEWCVRILQLAQQPPVKSLPIAAEEHSAY